MQVINWLPHRYWVRFDSQYTCPGSESLRGAVGIVLGTYLTKDGLMYLVDFADVELGLKRNIVGVLRPTFHYKILPGGGKAIDIG